MKNVLLFLLLGFLACKKDEVKEGDVISDLQIVNKNLEANGSSSTVVTVKLNRDADADKRKVVFTTSTGSFDGATGKTITQAAEFVSGELIARVTWKSSRTTSKVIISAKPEAISQYRDFSVIDSFETTKSVAEKVIASASSFSVPADFAGEIRISGAIRNGSNKDASTGYKVVFDDFFAGGLPAGGRFREIIAGNDDGPSVSALYSPGAIPAGTSMYVRITLLDASGIRTDKKDSVFFNVIKL